MTIEYKNLLVAIDGSTTSLKAFDYAVMLAKMSGATLFIVKVIDTRIDPFTPYVIEGEVEEIVAEAIEDMNKLANAAYKRGVAKAIPLVKHGSPKEIIAKRIPERENIDLIILGATGKGMFDRFLVGSTTSYVVKNALPDVLVIKNA